MQTSLLCSARPSSSLGTHGLSSVAHDLTNSGLTPGVKNLRHHGWLERQGCKRAGKFSVSVRQSDGGAYDDSKGSVMSGEKPGGADMMKLFNDAQQNMLFLNKQRMLALEELQKVERDREFLMAKVAQLEAESHAAAAAREVLEQRLKAAEAAAEKAESRGGALLGSPSASSPGSGRGKADPPSVWSSMLLRIDSMLLSQAINGGQAVALRGLVSSRNISAAEAFVEAKDGDDRDLSRALLPLLDAARSRSLHVVHICTELAPVTGGGMLGSWLLGLCRAMRRKGHVVEIVLPLYASFDPSHIDDFREASEVNSFFAGSWHQNKIWTGTVFGLPVTFIDPQHPGNFFSREQIYDYEDDFERFSYFSRAALDYLQRLNKSPDALHLHNWHTALVAPMFWDIFHKDCMDSTRLIFTCHDARFQTKQPAEKLQLVGLDSYNLNRPDRLRDNLEHSFINPLKGGIVYSNRVTTVSPIYAADVKSKTAGCGLEETFQAHSAKFVGLPSGLDDSHWNPTRDLSLPVPFSSDDFSSGKAVARAELRGRLELPVFDASWGSVAVPLVVCLMPQVSERDLEVLKVAMFTATREKAQLVFIGASRSPKVQLLLENLQRDVEDENVKLVIHYDEGLAHVAVAAADLLLCPSLHDPSAALPLIGMRYGALPVARQTGGTSDSIVDVDDPKRGAVSGNGFSFLSDQTNDMGAALARAINRVKSDPSGWEKLVRNAMVSDCGWDGHCVDGYVEQYWAIKKA